MDLTGIADIAQRASVSANTVHKWLMRYPDFPKPLMTLKRGRLWEWRQIEAWLKKTGRREA
jgi:predicted DNA-binding transcriptional regulator AlpA